MTFYQKVCHDHLNFLVSDKKMLKIACLSSLLQNVVLRSYIVYGVRWMYNYEHYQEFVSQKSNSSSSMLGNDLGCEVGGNGGGELSERRGEVGEADSI